MFGNKRQLCYQGANKVLHRQWALSSNHWRYCQGADKVKNVDCQRKRWYCRTPVVACRQGVVHWKLWSSSAVCLLQPRSGPVWFPVLGEAGERSRWEKGGWGAPSGAPWQAPGRTNFISIVPVFIWWEVYLRVTVQFVSWGLLFSLLLEGYCSFCYLRVTVQFVQFVTWG